MNQFRNIDRSQSAVTAGRIDGAPGWATGLRRLYGDIAGERVPADLGDLLARIERSRRRRQT